MEVTNEPIDSTIPSGKVYKENALWAGAFLGGPLVAGYLLSENFKTLGQVEKVTPTWIITIVATIVIFGGIFLIPESVNIPNQLFPIAYTSIAYGVFTKYQKESALEHVQKGGLLHGWGRVVGVSVVGLLLTLIPIFGIAFATDPEPYVAEEVNVSTKWYGGSMRHEIDFYESNISDEEVDKIAEGFKATGFFDQSIRKYVYVVKDGEKYEMSISVMPGFVDDELALQPFVHLRDDMDKYLPRHKVEIYLVVDYIENVVKVLK